MSEGIEFFRFPSLSLLPVPMIDHAQRRSAAIEQPLASRPTPSITPCSKTMASMLYACRAPVILYLTVSINPASMRSTEGCLHALELVVWRRSHGLLSLAARLVQQIQFTQE